MLGRLAFEGYYESEIRREIDGIVQLNRMIAGYKIEDDNIISVSSEDTCILAGREQDDKYKLSVVVWYKTPKRKA